MLNVTFNYVGHGDCILLEWKKEKGRGIGVIDCKAYGGQNPVVERLHALGCDAVDFILLSHPHHDHFSGLKEVFDYCLRHEVRIKHFYYTTFGGVPAYVKSIVLTQSEGDQLADVFRAMNELETRGQIDNRGLVNENTAPISLAPRLEARFFAPMQRQIDNFIESLHTEDLNTRDSPSSNLLSTFITVGTEDWHVFLTSDIERQALKGIGRGPLKGDEPQLVLGQVPHHGSIHNHYLAFWRSRKYENGTPLGISAGPNSHGHPAPETIKGLQELGFSVEVTGKGTESHFPEAERVLDIVSVKASRPRGKDLSYDINGAGVVTRV
ncbi:MAG: hypothetical protein BRD37_03460 [Bacteroidetes bacterium QH_8_67_23]|nr:MAG: hypothetical protein BRD37_03460 [Bacteroidetes bacterium QH_8_67_23]